MAHEDYKALSTGICGACPQCQSDFDMTEQELTDGVSNGSVPDEGGISKHGCDLCPSWEQQTLYPAHYLDDDDNIQHLEVCETCVLQINGY